MCNLAHTCEPPGEYGRATLKYIRSGKMPPSLFAYRVRKAARTQVKIGRARHRSRLEELCIQDDDNYTEGSPIHTLPVPPIMLRQPVTHQFDDSEGEAWMDEPDLDVPDSTAVPSIRPTSRGVNISSRSTHAPSTFSSAAPSTFVFPTSHTPAGFCQGCGDSLSTEMHRINGPCGTIVNVDSINTSPLNIPVVHPRNIINAMPQRTLICVPAYSMGLCAGCGDSLSTQMHIDNGPCL